MAFLGQLRAETAGPVYGWACDFCGQKAESSKREQPSSWYDSGGRRIEFSGHCTYTISSLYCTERCHAMWNKKPWPPEENEEEY